MKDRAAMTSATIDTATTPNTNAPVPIFDVDSHIAEPVDLWTSRAPARLRDKVPRVVWDESAGEHRWKVGNVLLSAVGEYCSAGWSEPFPSHPPTLDEAEHGCWEPTRRLELLDEWGVQAQVLYPNLIGFDTHAFLGQLGSTDATECVRIYNDFLSEFARTAPGRFVPIMMLPFWDIDAALAEMERAHAAGHKGVLFAALLQRIGLPNITKDHWRPLLSQAEDLSLSVNFHVGFSIREEESSGRGWDVRTKNALEQRTNRPSFVRRTAIDFSSNVEAAADVILGGVAARHPRLRFVSVESGFGYWPYVLEHMDWFWRSSGAAQEFPDRASPSDIWRRHFFATFWFETSTLRLLDDYADNVMVETDFPHETSLPALDVSAGDHFARALQDASLSADVIRKVCWDNAATLYGVSAPA